MKEQNKHFCILCGKEIHGKRIETISMSTPPLIFTYHEKCFKEQQTSNGCFISLLVFIGVLAAFASIVQI